METKQAFHPLFSCISWFLPTADSRSGGGFPASTTFQTGPQKKSPESGNKFPPAASHLKSILFYDSGVKAVGYVRFFFRMCAVQAAFTPRDRLKTHTNKTTTNGMKV